MRMFVLLVIAIMIVIVIVIVRMFLMIVFMRMGMLLMFMSMIMFMLIMVMRGVRVRLAMLVRGFVLFVCVRRSGMDAKFHAVDVLPLATLEVHVKISDFHLGQFPLESGRLDTQVAQRANGHVAADAGETVQEENAHGLRKNFSVVVTALCRRVCSDETGHGDRAT